MESSTDTDVSIDLACVADMCQYPRTCQWNNSCMEGQMKKSLDAKMDPKSQRPECQVGANADR